VSYEWLLRDWRGTVKKLSQDLGISWPRMLHEVDVQIERVLSSNHRHHEFIAEDLEARADVTVWVKDAYSAVLNAIDGKKKGLSDVFDRISADLETADLVFGPMLASSRLKLTALSGELAGREAEIKGLQGELAGREAEIKGLQGELVRLWNTVAQWYREAQERDREAQEVRLIITEIYNSNSWRITTPLRALKRGFSCRWTSLSGRGLPATLQDVRDRLFFKLIKSPVAKQMLESEAQQSVLKTAISEQQPLTSANRSIFTSPRQVLQTTLSVVIPTKNGVSEEFESTMRAISNQKGMEKIEIIVVDSGSSDGTVQIAGDFGAKVYRISPEEFGHGMTRNYGAQRSGGELIVFTTQDAIPATEDLFHDMAQALLADPKLAGISVRTVPKSNADIYACWEMWNHNRFLFDSPRPIISSSDEIDRLSPQELRQLASLDKACAMVKREVWERIPFEPTPYAEDLQFGLACLKEGYSIGLLPDHAVIHSHTRAPFYFMSRYYIDRRTLLSLFKEDTPPEWAKMLTPDQLFSSVKSLYLAINDFSRSLENVSKHDPTVVLKRLRSYISTRDGMSQRFHDGGGEPTLDELFASLEGTFKHDLSQTSLCTQGFGWKIDSILEFLGKRYSQIDRSEILGTIYKAYAATAGSLLGEVCFWQAQRGVWSSQLEKLDSVLSERMRKTK
jgi:GT2 family glycosyltransferase